METTKDEPTKVGLESSEAKDAFDGFESNEEDKEDNRLHLTAFITSAYRLFIVEICKTNVALTLTILVYIFIFH